jgi:hypothetical protein
VDGHDDLLGGNALEVDGSRAEVGVTELPLDDVQRHALAGEFERVRVTQLVRGEAPPDPGAGSEPAELAAHRGA